nr:viperin family antiviral radical SAM protein [Treponema sp.]
MEKLKINYHLTEACNFHCKFCFAKYDKEFIDFTHQKKVIKNIADSGLFDSINFAGGEPLLDKNLPALIAYSYSLGLKVSIITNGSLLTDEFLDSCVPYLEMLGISCHSFNEETKIEIGACTRNNKTLSNERLIAICERIEKMNQSGMANCKIKVNTVICAPNANENLLSGIESLKYVQRWKCLRCQEFGTNQKMLISKKQYLQFIKTNKKKGINQVFENDMKDTYIMINPAGYLICENQDGISYKKIGSAVDTPMEELM